MASPELIKAVSSYEAYIKARGIDERVIDAFVMAANTALINERDREYGLKVSGRAKEIIESFVQGRTGGSMWKLEKYCFANKTNYQILDKYYGVLLLEAQNRVFDSYLQYLEKKREPADRFYMPKRKQFMKFGLIDAFQDMIEDKCDILCISMPPGVGKAQPLYSKVLTPKGFKPMGDIHVGDKVIAGNGNVSKVIGVYPQGVMPIYELTFDDGSKCRCSKNHLWTVQTRDDRRRKRGYRTIELSQMMRNLKVENGGRLNYSLPYADTIDFAKKEFVIHPYVMGALLGDGGFSGGGVILSTIDDEIISNVNRFLPNGYCLKHHDRCSYRVNGHEGNNAKAGSLISIALKRYGLFGLKSDKKFIPNDYLFANREQRLWLLRGLLDTDGYASDRCAEFCTISEDLAKGVRQLVHSLGGYASLTQKDTGYKKNGIYKKCSVAYTVRIQFAKEHDPIFSLERKKEIYKPKRDSIIRFIKSVEYVGEEECQCIMIDDPSHLYITDDYIITHNTTLEKFFNSAVIGWYPKDFSLFYSHSGDITRMYFDGVLDIVNNLDEYTWHEIFPELAVTYTNAKMEQFDVNRAGRQKYKPFPSLQTASVGSKNAGKVRASKFLLVDDMIGGIEEALNKNILQKLWEKYTVDARQRKILDTDNKPCKEIMIATRWSTIDPIGRLMVEYADNPRVKAISVPDIDPETGESNFDYEFGGFSVEFFEDQAKLMDDISYNCLYKQQPIEREGLLYHEEDLRRFLTLPEREPDAVIGICDIKNKGTDFMFLPCCYQYDDDFYLVDCICDDDADFGNQEDRCSKLILDHAMQQCEFEANNGGERFAQNVNDRVTAGGGRCNITTKFTETNKETKIIVNADWVKKHILFKDKSLYEPKSDYGIMMRFLLGYSIAGKNAHDDIPDGLAMFALFATRTRRYAVVEAITNPFGGYSYGGY